MAWIIGGGAACVTGVASTVARDAGFPFGVAGNIGVTPVAGAVPGTGVPRAVATGGPGGYTAGGGFAGGAADAADEVAGSMA